MTELFDRALPRLIANRMPGLTLGDGQVVPDYNGYSLLNVPATVCRLLDVPAIGSVPLAADILEALGDRVRHVVVVLLDGLGLDRFNRALAEGDPPVWRRLRPEAIFSPITSVSPSTTTAALTTLWTGASPGAHGIVGYELWLKEFGVIANMIAQSPMTFANDVGGLRRAGFDPETFLPVPALGPHLVQNGVRVQAFMYHTLVRSGLSSMHLPSVKAYPFRSVSDLWMSARDWVGSAHKDRVYTYIYWSDLDEISHRFGPLDDRVGSDFASFSAVFEREFVQPLAQQGRGDTLVLVTADHGLIQTPQRPEFDLRNHPQFTSMLHMMPSGENRQAFLFVRPGKVDAAREYIEQAWPGNFSVFSREEVLTSGLYGPGPYSSRLPDRVGDLVVIAKGDAYLWWAAKENQMNGRHGGLSPQEMLVPLFAVRV